MPSSAQGGATTTDSASELKSETSHETTAIPAKKAVEKRWDETRGLLQQALADWEKSEQRAIEMLKDAEAERNHLEDLLLKLKAKLQELS